MGANGSFANGTTDSDAGRRWTTIDHVGNVQIIMKKDHNDSNKLPEESHTPNRIYAIFEKDGSDVKAIAKYGADGKKIWEIHTTDHKKMGEHYHLWKDGRPIQYVDGNGKLSNKAFSLTTEMKQLLNSVKNYER
jgi:hypothetical protein